PDRFPKPVRSHTQPHTHTSVVPPSHDRSPHSSFFIIHYASPIPRCIKSKKQRALPGTLLSLIIRHELDQSRSISKQAIGSVSLTGSPLFEATVGGNVSFGFTP